jgi:hypothetical protein
MAKQSKRDEIREPVALIDSSLTVKEPLVRARQHGNPTAKRAAEIMVNLNQGYLAPTAAQKKKIVIAFAKQNRVVYGKAYDLVRTRRGANVDFSDQDSIERNLDRLTLYEIKSTDRENVGADFANYFFALTTAELLVAQSLKRQFRFVFVNVRHGHHKELTLRQVLAKARGFYPQWSICF